MSSPTYTPLTNFALFVSSLGMTPRSACPADCTVISVRQPSRSCHSVPAAHRGVIHVNRFFFCRRSCHRRRRPMPCLTSCATTGGTRVLQPATPFSSTGSHVGSHGHLFRTRHERSTGTSFSYPTLPASLTKAPRYLLYHGLRGRTKEGLPLKVIATLHNLCVNRHLPTSY